MVVATAVLLGAAWLVPLPFAVARPGELVAAGDVVSLTISEQFAQDAGLRPKPVRGAFLAVRTTGRAALAEVATAAISPAGDVLADRPRSALPLQQPETVAALVGLGISAVRMEGADLPLTVVVEDAVDPAAVAVALHLFDATAAQNVAKGRRVAGIGRMEVDQTFTCEADPAASVAAAVAAGADVVVVPTACADEVSDPGVAVLAAGSLTEAVAGLLEQG